MKVRAEATWSGGERHGWRLTLPDGRRANIPANIPGRWDRKTAKDALDMLEIEFRGIPRRSIRFNVH